METEEKKVNATPDNTSEEEFDYSLAQPTDKQQVESMRVDPYDDTYANFMYGQSVGDESVNVTPKVTPLPEPKATPKTTAMTSALPDSVRKTLQKKQGKFVAPHPEPTTYKEIMENWEAKDEYDKQIAKKQNRMRLIGQAIAGAGEIAARLATGASGQNVMGDIMLKDNAQALDNLKTLRAQNKERFGTQLTMMQQENALKRQAALDKQTQANKDREFNLAWSKANRDFDIKIAQLKESGRLNDAKIAESEKKQAYYDLMQKYYPEKVKSEIAKNNSQTTANYKRAAKDEDEIKTVQQIDVKGKTYKLPKNSRVINARSAVVDALKNKLNDLDANARAKAEAYINQEVNQFENNSPEAIIDGLNKIAQDFPELVDNALTRISKKEEGSSSRNNPYSSGGSNSHDDPYGQH